MADHRRTTRFPPDEPIRVVVVESRAIVGVGVREILDQAPDIEVLAYVASPGEAIPVVDEVAPDVVLIETTLPEPEATAATRRLRRDSPDSAIVVLGGDDDASIVGSVEAGAVAHVAVMAEPAELVATIRRAANGEDPLKAELINRPELVERFVEEVRGSMLADPRPSDTLTARELDVLAAIAAGSRNRDAAEVLGISEQTIKNHLSTIFHKLGVPNRTRAVTYAVRQGWLVLDTVPDWVVEPAARE